MILISLLYPGNDFGDSHYIADTNLKQTVPSAATYVKGHPHCALRALLPAFIAAYKAGAPSAQLPPVHEAFAVAWYRTMPALCGWDGGEWSSLFQPSPLTTISAAKA